MSLFKVSSAAILAAVFVFSGCKEPEKTVEPGPRKERAPLQLDTEKNTQSMEIVNPPG